METLWKWHLLYILDPMPNRIIWVRHFSNDGQMGHSDNGIFEIQDLRMIQISVIFTRPDFRMIQITSFDQKSRIIVERTIRWRISYLNHLKIRSSESHVFKTRCSSWLSCLRDQSHGLLMVRQLNDLSGWTRRFLHGHRRGSINGHTFFWLVVASVEVYGQALRVTSLVVYEKALYQYPWCALK